MVTSATMFELPLLLVDRAVTAAIEEDLSSGDPTSEACIPADLRAVAHATARQPLVVCGGPVFARVFERLDADASVEVLLPEGARAAPGQRLWTVRGRARSVLAAERVALNFAQRLSGVWGIHLVAGAIAELRRRFRGFTERSV